MNADLIIRGIRDLTGTLNRTNSPPLRNGLWCDFEQVGDSSALTKLFPQLITDSWFHDGKVKHGFTIKVKRQYVDRHKVILYN